MKKLLLACCFLLAGPVLASAEEATGRIVSVGGAVTEILFAIGAGDRVVGNDTTSYFPPAAAKLPKVGYMRALPAEGVLSLKPDSVIMTTDAGPGPVLEQIKAVGVKGITVKAAMSLEETLDNIQQISRAVGKTDAGKALVEKLSTDLAALEKKIGTAGKKPRVLFVMQHGGSPMMTAGTNTSAAGIIELAGGINAVTGFEGYKPLTAEAAVAQKPDYILVTSHSVKSLGGAEQVLKAPGLSLTPAGKTGNVIEMDTLLLLGFGPRTVEAATKLFDLTHP